MKVLLDTHAFLWWVNDDRRLSDRAREVIGDGATDLFLSAASGWEIAIKTRLGKLQLPSNLDQFIVEQLAMNSIESLPILLRHGLHVANLPQHHRDPFDRILIAQSQLDDLPIVTADHVFAQYDVQVIW